MRCEGKLAAAKVNVVFVSDAEIRKLNKKFHHSASFTDVLAFDLGEELEIVVSADTAQKNARAFGTSSKYELLLYVIHGLLHFLGFDDKTEKQRIAMQKRAEKILNHVYP
ncbi:MAG: rRNA maturation RNase YbeY [Candidatus Omnitrophica bacterium]|nr:rRNA maturation RNase YbeY [Candidatus Omnitrophota bacterium]MDD5610547.1 rRNA maturation RNase YbeY [Candidatus Omnitrophota bacterium]